MKIKEEYSKKLIQVGNMLNQSYIRIGMIEHNIKQILEQKQNLITNIKKINEQKNQLVKEISDEYGQGYIDPKTWQFFPTQDDKEDNNKK